MTHPFIEPTTETQTVAALNISLMCVCVCVLTRADFLLGSDCWLVCRLCYLFCRATRAVSVCPPAYYAHLAAFRQRELCQMSDSSASDTESTMSGTAADATVEFATCHKDLGSTMYYV